MFTTLFVLAALPALHTLLKILGRKGLSIFDVTVLFSTLYFVIIPVNDFLYNHQRPDYIGNTATAWAVFLYMWFLWGLAFIYAKKTKSPLFITERLTEIRTIQVKDSFQWFIFVYVLFVLYKTTDYSSLNAEDIEGNNNFFYGADQGFLMKAIVSSSRSLLPMFFVLLWTNRPRKKLYQQLRGCNFLLLAVCLLLGPKGFMVFNCVFLTLYMYSIKRKTMSRGKMIVWASVFIFIFSVLFPLSQSFRYYKQDLVKSSSQHDFLTVVKGFITDGVDASLQSRVEDYQENRSLNVYDAVDFAATRTGYRGNGHLTGIVLSYIIPQRMRQDGNIMADLMQGGGDVGESLPAWYVLDWGVPIGALVAALHCLLWNLLYYYFGIFFNRWIRSSIYPLVVYTTIMARAVNSEVNPSADIKIIYNTYYLVILFAGLVLYYFKVKHNAAKTYR